MQILCNASAQRQETENFALFKQIKIVRFVMCAACGYRVETLCYIRIANIHLGNIPQGNFRNVTDAEFDKLIKDL